MNFLDRYPEVKNHTTLRKPAINEKKGGYNTASNKTMVLHKDMSDELIGQFTTLNETDKISYFD